MIELNSTNNCIAIGGVGGSGTRLVAELCKQLGFHLGSNLNISNDNNNYPDLRGMLVNSCCDAQEQNQKFAQAINVFIEDIKSETLNRTEYIGWGWKVPGTFFNLKHFNKLIPSMKYIHVVRNGLDMAFSSNQNQLKNWGPLLGINYQEKRIHKDSLDYWLEANNLAIETGLNLMKERFHVLEFDNLCNNPKDEFLLLLEFLNINTITETDLKKLINMIKIPKSINRYLNYDYSNIFDDNQIQRLEQLQNKIAEIRNLNS